MCSGKNKIEIKILKPFNIKNIIILVICRRKSTQ
jgi:hypothetical protein